MSASYFSMRKIYIALPALLVFTALSTAAAEKQAECTQGSTCVSINGGNDPMSAEQARQSKQQWDDNKSMRYKKNKQAEKEFDKQINATDARDNCTKSANVNAYWEPNTERCLDRHTGQPVMP